MGASNQRECTAKHEGCITLAACLGLPSTLPFLLGPRISCYSTIRPRSLLLPQCDMQVHPVRDDLTQAFHCATYPGMCLILLLCKLRCLPIMLAVLQHSHDVHTCMYKHSCGLHWFVFPSWPCQFQQSPLAHQHGFLWRSEGACSSAYNICANHLADCGHVPRLGILPKAQL